MHGAAVLRRRASALRLEAAVPREISVHQPLRLPWLAYAVGHDG